MNCSTNELASALLHAAHAHKLELTPPPLYPGAPGWIRVEDPLEGYDEWFVRVGCITAVELYFDHTPDEGEPGWWAAVGERHSTEDPSEERLLSEALDWIRAQLAETRSQLSHMPPQENKRSTVAAVRKWFAGIIGWVDEHQGPEDWLNHRGW